MESEKLAHDDDDYVNLLYFSFQAFQGLLENEVCAPLSTHQQR